MAVVYIYAPNINRVRTSIEIYICKPLHLHELCNMLYT